MMMMMMMIETTMSEAVAAEFHAETAAFEGRVRVAGLPSSPPQPSPSEGEGGREERYEAALKLVARIDEELTRGVRHYRTKAGALLGTLDEVIRAILEDQLEVTSWAN